MSKHEIVDGSCQDPAGNWFTYLYALCDGELIFVSCFNASTYSHEYFVFEYEEVEEELCHLNQN